MEEWDVGRPVYLPISHERTRAFHEDQRYPHGLESIEPEQRKLGDQPLAEASGNTPRAEDNIWFREFPGAEAWPVPYSTKPHFLTSSERALRWQDGSPSMQTASLINEPWSSSHVKIPSDLPTSIQKRIGGRNMSSPGHHRSQTYLQSMAGEGAGVAAFPGISVSDVITRSRGSLIDSERQCKTVYCMSSGDEIMLEKAETRTSRQPEHLDSQFTPDQQGYWSRTEQLNPLSVSDFELRHAKDRATTGKATSDPQSGYGQGRGVHTMKGDRIIRAGGGKDRHSKVRTSKGPRDRRVRLSVSTAIQFYDIQDRLGCDQPSKAIDWLMKKAKAAIDELPRHPNNPLPLLSDESSVLFKTSRKGEVAVYSATSDIAGPGRDISGSLPPSVPDETEIHDSQGFACQAKSVAANSDAECSREAKELQNSAMLGVKMEHGFMKPAERRISTSSSTSDGSRELDNAALTCGKARWVNARKRARERTVEKHHREGGQQ